MNNVRDITCCFIGHREIADTEELRNGVWKTVENLIISKGVTLFLFGSKSRFNTLCYEIVTDLKEKYPQLKRVYVRAEFPKIDESYQAYLLQSYEDTDYPPKVLGAGRAAYVERNYEMIDRSQVCVFYFRDDYEPAGRKSGTKLALGYALKQGKEIICI